VRDRGDASDRLEARLVKIELACAASQQSIEVLEKLDVARRLTMIEVQLVVMRWLAGTALAAAIVAGVGALTQ